MAAHHSHYNSAVNEEFLLYCPSEGGPSSGVLNLTVLLWFLNIVNIKTDYFRRPAWPWEINQGVKMKRSGKLACGSQLWGWDTVLRVNCMFWLTSSPNIWLPQLSLNSSPTPLLSHMKRALEQTGANLPGKIRMKILLIDISAPHFPAAIRSRDGPVIPAFEPGVLSHGNNVSCVDLSRRAKSVLAFSHNMWFSESGM